MNDPNALLESMVADWGGSEYAELAILVSATRALAMLHKANHWRTKGNDYYGDHLLFDRLAGSVAEDIDGLAERLVGLSSSEMVEPGLHASQTERFLRDAMPSTADMRPDDLVVASLQAEFFYLDLIDAVLTSLEQKGALSKGTDNLLVGIADKHEGLIYLLKQRTSG